MATAEKDLYEILGVDRDATDDQIKKAFRRRARELHPDVNKSPNADEEFKELNEAYDVLSDAAKRSQYDRFGTIPGAASSGAGYVDFEDIFGGFGGMGDIFSSFFGGAQSSARNVSKNGRDMGIGIEITLEEAACGIKREIVYDRLAPCADCNATGLGEGGRVVECQKCQGSGQVITVQRTILGEMQSRSTCDACGGTGKSIEGACEECEGQGRVPDRQRVSIDIPKGIKDGQQLRIEGLGEAGYQGAPSGNLIVTARVRPHELFERDGNDLHASLTITMMQASLGCSVLIDGILEDEKVEVKIPSGIQPGESVRVKGKGMPKMKSDSRGNLILHIDIEIPKRLKPKQRKSLEKLAAEMGENLTRAPVKINRLRDVR